MLEQLVAYAYRKELTVEPGFAPKELRWLVSVREDGTITGVVPLGDGKRGETFPCCPDLQQPEMIRLPGALGVEQAAHFLADTCGVIALLPALDREGNAKADAKSQEDFAKNQRKHPTFRLLIKRASAEVPLLESIHAALSRPEQVEYLRSELARAGARETDKLSFLVGETSILKSDVWHGWWRDFRGRTFGSEESGKTDGKRMVCLATAARIVPTNTHPKVTKLGVGANMSGASLIGYDKDAFASFGLMQGENGAVSEDAAAAYRAALDHLLRNAPTLGQMKVALWYDRDLPDEDDLFADLFDPSAEASALERARKLLRIIRTGEGDAKRLGTTRYFGMALTGAAGRVMVRDFLTGSLEELAEAVAAWFGDLSIVNVNGSRTANLPGLERLLRSVLPAKKPGQSDDDYLKPARLLQQPLWRAALCPAVPLPLSAVTRLMEAYRASVLTGDFEKAVHDQKVTLGTVYARMGLIKAYYNRMNRGGYQMEPTLNPDHPEPAYHCGRLMCLLAGVQEKALGSEINAGVVQRYYGAASATPALVLGRLTRLSQHHLAKIGSDPRSRGLAFWLEGQIAAVWNALGSGLPATLTLEQQSLFALGYYQQLAYNRTKRSGNPEAPQTDDDTPTENPR